MLWRSPPDVLLEGGLQHALFAAGHNGAMVHENLITGSKLPVGCRECIPQAASAADAPKVLLTCLAISNDAHVVYFHHRESLIFWPCKQMFVSERFWSAVSQTLRRASYLSILFIGTKLKRFICSVNQVFTSCMAMFWDIEWYRNGSGSSSCGRFTSTWICGLHPWMMIPDRAVGFCGWRPPNREVPAGSNPCSRSHQIFWRPKSWAYQDLKRRVSLLYNQISLVVVLHCYSCSNVRRQFWMACTSLPLYNRYIRTVCSQHFVAELASTNPGIMRGWPNSSNYRITAVDERLYAQVMLAVLAATRIV